MADLAWAWGWPPSELKTMTVSELLFWKAQAVRLGPRGPRGR